MSTNSVKFHRVIRATPERIYRAFLDADALAKWLPPNGFTGKVHRRWTRKLAATTRCHSRTLRPAMRIRSAATI